MDEWHRNEADTMATLVSMAQRGDYPAARSLETRVENYDLTTLYGRALLKELGCSFESDPDTAAWLLASARPRQRAAAFLVALEQGAAILEQRSR